MELYKPFVNVDLKRAPLLQHCISSSIDAKLQYIDLFV